MPVNAFINYADIRYTPSKRPHMDMRRFHKLDILLHFLKIEYTWHGYFYGKSEDVGANMGVYLKDLRLEEDFLEPLRNIDSVMSYAIDKGYACAGFDPPRLYFDINDGLELVEFGTEYKCMVRNLYADNSRLAKLYTTSWGKLVDLCKDIGGEHDRRFGH